MKGSSFLLAVLLLAALPAAAQLVQGTQPAMPVRGVGVNEGFTDLPGYSLGQPTTTTAADITRRGYRVVKIWPIYQRPENLGTIFSDPGVNVIVYRPLHNSTQLTECGTTTFVWENVDYGQIATTLYQLYGNQPKIVILTGWESDNQIDHLPVGSPTCGWPVQTEVDNYRHMLEQRQIGVRTAREANAAAKLRVYHAVELRQVPDFPGGSLTVLDQIIPKMSEPPDFISFSAWGSTPAKITTKLDSILKVSKLTRDRIYVGEWGCKVNNVNRASCFRDHANNAFNWGIRLWIVWSYASTGGGNSYDLIDVLQASHPDTPNGFSVIGPVNTSWGVFF